MKVDVKDVLYLIRLYRHDLMNQLQLVDGYASMKQYETSQEKLHLLIQQLKNERLLQTLNAPQYVYWLIQLKLEERDKTIDFDIEQNDHSLEELDEKLVHDGKALLGQIKNQMDAFNHLHILIQIKHDEAWYIKYQVKGIELPDDLMVSSYGSLNVLKSDNTTSFVFTYK